MAFSAGPHTVAMHLLRRAWSMAGDRVRHAGAIAAARGSSRACRAIGRPATSLPGFVAEGLDPAILERLMSRHQPVVLVIGTNGKTTTTWLLATILERLTGRRPTSNRSGANLSQGIVTALVEARATTGPAVFEVDELAFARIAGAVRPDVVVILNLVRDQLDRYGEVDAVVRRWREALRALPPTTDVVACGDDPRVVSVLDGLSLPTRWFGLASARSEAPSASAGIGIGGSAPCPRCGAPTDVDDSTASRGPWSCRACGAVRPSLDLAVRIASTEHSPLDLDFEAATRATDWDHDAASVEGIGSASLRLSGTAGAHDVAAAILAAIALGADPRRAVRAIDGATPAFGRLEELVVDRRRVILSLTKNPSSAAHATEAAAARKPDRLLLGLNDAAADGRDVSWIWDARLDVLAALAPLTLTGARADDLALRFKYGCGGVDPRHPPIVDRSIEHALLESVRRVRPGGTLMVLGTYTALLGFRRILERRGLVAAIPQ